MLLFNLFSFLTNFLIFGFSRFSPLSFSSFVNGGGLLWQNANSSVARARFYISEFEFPSPECCNMTRNNRSDIAQVSFLLE
jgi:hypothetical protein